MLTLDAFEEATEVVKKVAIETNLLYSDSVSYTHLSQSDEGGRTINK